MNKAVKIERLEFELTPELKAEFEHAKQLISQLGNATKPGSSRRAATVSDAYLMEFGKKMALAKLVLDASTLSSVGRTAPPAEYLRRGKFPAKEVAVSPLKTPPSVDITALIEGKTDLSKFVVTKGAAKRASPNNSLNNPIVMCAAFPPETLRTILN